MGSSSIKPTHRFFERQLDNDLEDLYSFLDKKLDDILISNIFDIPAEELSKFNRINGAPTQLGQYYNIFTFDHPGIKSLHQAISSMMNEAKEYYGLNEDIKFYLSGWFNLDYKTENVNYGVSPIRDPKFFHDHMNGEGSPVFHGYYCVNAEPSITYYDIDKSGNIFENINKNNRAILSETGHPHGRDDWFEDKPRVTIAYDVTPYSFGGLWIEL